MKKLLMLTILTGIFLTGEFSFAEPPEKYMNDLKLCTPSTTNVSAGAIEQYVIKGKLPDGRCHVEITSYPNYEDPQVYKAAIELMRSMAEGFTGQKIADKDLPTQQEMIKQAKAEKSFSVCKFTEDQRKALYSAYLKHDGKDGTKRDQNGNVTGFSFSLNNLSSYDILMTNYQMGTCNVSKKSTP